MGWLHQGRDLRISQQCCLPYIIKPFTNEVLCDVGTLDVCDVLLGQPYLWKQPVVYESKARAIIVTLGNKLYRMPEVASPTTISLVSGKQCSKLISKIKKFVFPDDTPSRKEEDGGHNLQTRALCMTTIDGQGRGGVQGHLHLPHWGASARLGEALHRSDPRSIVYQWTHLSVLYSREQ